MEGIFTVLAFGDVVGQYSTEKVCRNIRKLKTEYGADMVIVNAENAANGNGLDVYSADRLLHFGADVLTSGNHIWKKSEIRNYIQESDFVLRPANYPDSCPGRGYTIFETFGVRVLVINAIGTVYMDCNLSPFDAIERILRKNEKEYDLAILDFHAEATAEKLAVANYFDGRLSAVVGTHTHVQTNDARLLKNGTAYITDLGMTGRIDSILGVDCAPIIEHMTTLMPTRFTVNDGETECDFAVLRFDLSTKKALEIKPVKMIISV